MKHERDAAGRFAAVTEGLLIVEGEAVAIVERIEEGWRCRALLHEWRPQAYAFTDETIAARGWSVIELEP